MPAAAATAAAQAAGSANNTVPLLAALLIAALIAAMISLVVGGLLRRLFASFERGHPGRATMSKTTVRLVRLLTFAISMVALATPALEMAGITTSIGPGTQEIGHWATRTGVRVAVILLGAFAVNHLIAMLIAQAEHELESDTGFALNASRQRARTLAGSLRRMLAAIVWSVTLLMVLRQLDVDITPILTGAGILGLAVGFGAQTLVRDVISGFFLIIDDYIRVGDVAVVNGVGGQVEEINLRTLVLRDVEGTIHVFPNGEVKTLANRTRDFAYYVIDLPMGYGDDSDGVAAAARAAAEELRRDATWASSILEPLEVMGLDAFGTGQMALKMRIRTVPGRQWDVGRELRRRIKIAFDQRGIRMPVPQMAVTLRQPASPGDAGATAVLSTSADD